MANFSYLEIEISYLKTEIERYETKVSDLEKKLQANPIADLLAFRIQAMRWLKNSFLFENSIVTNKNANKELKKLAAEEKRLEILAQNPIDALSVINEIHVLRGLIQKRNTEAYNLSERLETLKNSKNQFTETN